MNKFENTALILIDIQNGFDDMEYYGGQRNNPTAEANCRTMLDYWRVTQLPIFHVQHCSTNPVSKLFPGNPGNDIKEIVAPRADEPIIQKSVNSAFIGTNLKEQLDGKDIKKLVIVGLTTDHCVSTTTRMAGNYGFETYLIADATATFPKTGINGEKYDAETIHQTALASLNNEFATVINTRELLDLLASSK